MLRLKTNTRRELILAKRDEILKRLWIDKVDKNSLYYQDLEYKHSLSSAES
jgi:hypothetical protein